jgi:putative transposase
VFLPKAGIQERGVLGEMVLNYGFEIDEMEVVQDHVHVFSSFTPRYSISKVGGVPKV